jgi:hypothetical protein
MVLTLEVGVGVEGMGVFKFLSFYTLFNHAHLFIKNLN